MNTPFSFAFQNSNIRVLQIEDKPWFVAADVCRVLGLRNATMASRNLSTDEVTLSRIEGQRGLPMRLVSESGLYKLIMRSDKAKAHEMQEWVTRVVLPTLRKDGMYIVGEERHSVEGLTAEEIYKLALEMPTGATACDRHAPLGATQVYPRKGRNGIPDMVYQQADSLLDVVCRN